MRVEDHGKVCGGQTWKQHLSCLSMADLGPHRPTCKGGWEMGVSCFHEKKEMCSIEHGVACATKGVLKEFVTVSQAYLMEA